MSGLDQMREVGEATVNAVLERVGRGMSHVQERKPLPYDLLESDDAYLVVFDAPGTTRSDLQVRFLDGEVQVRIDRFRDFHEGYEMRFPGRGLSLDGRADLPDDAGVEADEATATLSDDGTLRVRIPKSSGGTAVAVTDEEDEREATGDDGTADAEGSAETDEGAEADAADERDDD